MEEAIIVLLNALKEYLRIQGTRILSVLEITSQDRIRIEVRALYRYFKPTQRFRKLSDTLRKLENEKLREELEKIGINLVMEDDTLFLEISKNYIKKLLN